MAGSRAAASTTAALSTTSTSARAAGQILLSPKPSPVATSPNSAAAAIPDSMEQRLMAAEARAKKAEEGAKFVAHEMRVCLQQMLGSTAAIDQVTQDLRAASGRPRVAPTAAAPIEQLQKISSSISVSIQDGLLVLNNQLDLATMQESKLSFVPRALSLNQFLKRTQQAFQLSTTVKGLEFRLEMTDEELSIISDSSVLARVFNNFISNSIKFTEQGAITLTVKVLSRDTHSYHLHIIIQDTGIGMKSEALAKLGRKFAQFHDREMKDYGGTGLGLNIALAAIKVLNGSVTVKSQEGQGTSFILDFNFAKAPLLQQQKVEVLPQKGPALTSTPTLAQPQRKLRVLFVEDNAQIRLIFDRHIRSAGHLCILADSGEKALEACTHAASTNEPIDFIFMDVQMPGMGGIAACKKIREFQRSKQGAVYACPIIGLSGDGREQETALSAGMTEYRLKPIKPTEFQALLAKHASQHRSIDEKKASPSILSRSSLASEPSCAPSSSLAASAGSANVVVPAATTPSLAATTVNNSRLFTPHPIPKAKAAVAPSPRQDNALNARQGAGALPPQGDTRISTPDCCRVM